MVRRVPPIPHDAGFIGEPALRASVAAWAPGEHAAGAAHALHALQELECGRVDARAGAEFWAGRHLQMLGELDLALAHAKRGLDISPAAMVDLRADLHALAALCFSELGDQIAGAAQAELALALGLAHDSPRIQSVALARLGLCTWRGGNILKAESILFRALSFAREANCPEEVLGAMSGLVGVSIAAWDDARALGDTEGERAALARTIQHAERAVRTARRANDQDAWLRCMNNQAKCLTMAGRPGEAEAILNQVIGQSDERGLRLLSMRARYNLALALIAADRAPAAVATLETVLSMLEQTEHLPLRRACRSTLEQATARAALAAR